MGTRTHLCGPMTSGNAGLHLLGRGSNVAPWPLALSQVFPTVHVAPRVPRMAHTKIKLLSSLFFRQNRTCGSQVWCGFPSCRGLGSTAQGRRPALGFSPTSSSSSMDLATGWSKVVTVSAEEVARGVCLCACVFMCVCINFLHQSTMHRNLAHWDT